MHGKSGKLVFGESVVAGVTNWLRAEKADLVEAGAQGGGDDKEYEFGRRDATYAIEGNYDAADVDGQGQLAGGMPVEFKLYPEGFGDGKKYFAGSGLVESVDITGPLDGKIGFAATIRQSGEPDPAPPRPGEWMIVTTDITAKNLGKYHLIGAVNVTLDPYAIDGAVIEFNDLRGSWGTASPTVAVAEAGGEIEFLGATATSVTMMDGARVTFVRDAQANLWRVR